MTTPTLRTSRLPVALRLAPLALVAGLLLCPPTLAQQKPKTETEQVRVRAIFVGTPGETHEIRELEIEDGRLRALELEPEALKRARRAFLGVETTPLTPELRLHFGAPEQTGVLVARVEEASPAAAAGLRVGDVLTTVEGRPVGDLAELVAHLRNHKAGDRVKMTVVRDKRRRDLTATLEERERTVVDVRRWIQYPGEGPVVYQVDDEVAAEMVRHLQGAEMHSLIVRLRAREASMAERLRKLEEQFRQLERELAKERHR